MLERRYDIMVGEAANWLRMVQVELDTVHFIKGTADESSLLFSNERALGSFVQWAYTEGGLERMGSVPSDRMMRMDSPKQEWFDVRFEFMKVPDTDWRIEAMCILDGVAPLHSAALAKYGEGSVVHVSWRAAPNGDAEGYRRHRKVLETAGVADPMPFLAEYRNSYGRFSYYGLDGKPPYLKPRVNLRDQ